PSSSRQVNGCSPGALPQTISRAGTAGRVAIGRVSPWASLAAHGHLGRAAHGHP
ncbi:hypothetical protein HK405_005843, partial [Cladochytrium tenue]